MSGRRAAQHTIAGGYGFASWPKLETHVEALAARSEPPIFSRFTPKARESLFFSWHEANQLRSGMIEPAHLLLGVLRDGDTPATALLVYLNEEAV